MKQSQLHEKLAYAVDCLTVMSCFVLSVIMAVRLSTQRVWHTFNYDWKRANVVIAYLVNE